MKLKIVVRPDRLHKSRSTISLVKETGAELEISSFGWQVALAIAEDLSRFLEGELVVK